MKRYYILVLPLVLALHLSAQSSRRVHMFHCASDLSASAEKFITEQVKALDQEGLVSIDGRLVKIGVDGRVFRHVLLDAINQAGVGSFDMAPSLVKSAATGEIEGDVPFPVQHDTGDPATDHLNYLAAKAAWIAAHPELYLDPSTNMHR